MTSEKIVENAGDDGAPPDIRRGSVLSNKMVQEGMSSEDDAAVLGTLIVQC